jgi:hypothetical protein
VLVSCVISWYISMASSESAAWLGLEHVGWSICGLGLMGLWLLSTQYGLCAFEIYDVCMLMSMLRVQTDYLRLSSLLCDVCGCPVLSEYTLVVVERLE